MCPLKKYHETKNFHYLVFSYGGKGLIENFFNFKIDLDKNGEKIYSIEYLPLYTKLRSDLVIFKQLII